MERRAILLVGRGVYKNLGVDDTSTASKRKWNREKRGNSIGSEGVADLRYSAHNEF